MALEPTFITFFFFLSEAWRRDSASVYYFHALLWVTYQSHDGGETLKRRAIGEKEESYWAFFLVFGFCSFLFSSLHIYTCLYSGGKDVEKGILSDRHICV